ncbi:FAD-binding oxidoreductase [Streptomyces sp. P38-E01]|uniref:FAD-binding oxidoreductase n=1 Tax=Streptomyces tardus TaxID=2780544 RepID=A0A949NA17_9ACTN|nr:FAD-binding oxidoreductase [Streptomyces tardus]MBU7599448.1 FAD-binding oxidoreductase [Streptomyces tardus]
MADGPTGRSWWGWGNESEQLGDEECAALGALLPGLREHPVPVPDIRRLDLPTPRLAPPGALAELVSADPALRAAHTYGKAFRDVVRVLAGEMAAAPDLVALPRREADVVDLLDWASRENVAVVPFGGGSSVVGGVEYREGDHAGVLSLDLTRLDRVLEVDRESRAARIQAGAFGPALEAQLRPHGYTLRHFPQSFEFSTLGGWLATRAGGHYATGHTHIDDFVESMRVVAPSGVHESWRLPGSGAGPSPDRLFLGSEGALGVITEAWLRVQERPAHKASASVLFDDFPAALRAVRTLAQSGLNPANCRLLDPGEAMLGGAGDGSSSVLVLGFESAGQPVDALLEQALDLVRGHGGRVRTGGGAGGRPAADRGDGSAARPAADPAGAWRSAFLRMPYLRDAMTRMGAVVETFETALTWDRAPELIEAVRTGLGRAVEEITGRPGILNCRLTHVYPDGCAPYFTVIAAGRVGAQRAMWDEIKAAAGEILVRHRATITHHHAVGRDHRTWYDRQRPELFADVLRSAKSSLDPAGILNPGVLVD